MSCLRQFSFAFLFALLASAAWADTTVSASSYIQDGLVVQFDGVENTGVGTHDAMAMTWVDLTGNGRNGKITGSYAWQDDGLKINSALTSDRGLVTFDATHEKSFTFDICLKVDKTYGPYARIIGENGTPAMCCYGRGSSVKSAHAYLYGLGIDQDVGSATYDATAIHTSTLLQSGNTADGVDWYHDGALLAHTTVKSTSTGSATATLGNNSGYSRGLDGVYYSVRIYNRVLSPEEIAYNASVDKVRFEGGDPESIRLAATVAATSLTSARITARHYFEGAHRLVATVFDEQGAKVGEDWAIAESAAFGKDSSLDLTDLHSGDYTVVVRAIALDSETVAYERTFSLPLWPRYKLRTSDTEPTQNSIGSSPTHLDNWVNVFDAQDILERPIAGAEYVVEDGLAARSSSPGFEFIGKRLYLRGTRTTPMSSINEKDFSGGSQLLLMNGNTTHTFSDLVIENAAVRHRGWWNNNTTTLDGRVTIPAGKYAFFEPIGGALGDDNRNFAHAGVVVGSGTFVINGSPTSKTLRYILKADFSAFTGRVELHHIPYYKFQDGFVPAADFPSLDKRGVWLDTNEQLPNSYYFDHTLASTNENRGVMITGSSVHELCIKKNCKVTLRNPLYGTGNVTKKAVYRYLAGFYGNETNEVDVTDSTLRLEGAQGEWTGTLTVESGTVELAGAKPMGEGTLDTTAEGAKAVVDGDALEALGSTNGCFVGDIRPGSKITFKWTKRTDFTTPVTALRVPVATGLAAGDVDVSLELPETTTPSKDQLSVNRSVRNGEIVYSVGPRSVSIDISLLYYGAVRISAGHEKTGQTCRLVATVADRDGKTVGEPIVLSEAAVSGEFYSDEVTTIPPGADYTVTVRAYEPGGEILVCENAAEISLLPLYRLLESDGGTAASSLVENTTHISNWVSVADAEDILERPIAAAEYIVENGLSVVARGDVCFIGKRLYLRGTRTSSNHNASGTQLQLNEADMTHTIPDLIVENASVRHNGWWDDRKTTFDGQVTIPAEKYAFFDPCSQWGNVDCRWCIQKGSVVGAGTYVVVGLSPNYLMKYELRVDFSAFTGKMNLRKMRYYRFVSGFRPPAELPVFDEKGVWLETDDTIPNTYYFDHSCTSTNVKRGLTLSGECAHELYIANKCKLTLRNPLYGTADITKKAAYSLISRVSGTDKTNVTDVADSTLRLEGAQGTWTGKLTVEGGTLELAGAKPMGEGTLDTTAEGAKAVVDGDALGAEGCFIANIAKGSKITLKWANRTDFSSDAPALRVPLATGLEKGDIDFTLDLPETTTPSKDKLVVRRSAQNDEIVFSVSPKRGIVIVVR